MSSAVSSILPQFRLDRILDRFKQLHIVVIGDFFLDKYLVTDPGLSEVSIETGLEARQVVEVRCSPGAAGTVTNNLAALGVARIEAVGAIGEDGEGYELRRGLAAKGVKVDALRAFPGIFTPTYTKPMVREAGLERELERIDIKNRTPFPQPLQEQIVLRLRGIMERTTPDAVIIADQVQERNCGVVTDMVREALSELAQTYPQVVFFADSRRRIGEFGGITLKPNQHEAAHALGRAEPIDNLENAETMGVALASKAGKTVFLTIAEKGILVCGPTGCTHIPTLPVDGPIDIVGAGDSATAGMVCALCTGASDEEAAMVGNLCASVTIRKLGTTGTASPDEVRQIYSHSALP